MNTPQIYITDRLDRINNKIVSTVPGIESPKGLADFICHSILSKKYRKYAVSSEYKEHVRSSVILNMEKGEPIKFALPFGGYKLWRMEEAPEVDWAELFSFIYFVNWLTPIARYYKPGIWFDFSSSDIIIERLNNILTSETDAYQKGFFDLLSFIKLFVPENMRFTLTPVSSRYTNEEFIRELNEKMDKIKQTNRDSLLQLTPKQKRMIELNVRLTPDQALDPLWREKNFLLYEAYLSLDRVRSYYRTPDKIVVSCASRNASIATGTTKTSIMKFWIGAGVLHKISGGFIESIFSSGQLMNAQSEWFNVSIDGLTGKNFRKVRVIHSLGD